MIANGRTVQALDPGSRVLWSNPLGAHHDVDVDALGRIFTLRRFVDEVVWRGQPLRIVDEGIAILAPDGELERTIWLDRLLRKHVDPAILDAAVEKQRALAPRLRRYLGLARLDEQGADVYHANSIDVLDTDVPGYGISWLLIGSIALVSAGIFLLVMMLLVRARRRAVVSGPEEMIGSKGRVLDWDGHQGRVRVHGEIWQARAVRPLRGGRDVRVAGIEGLTLVVEPETKVS